VFDCIVISCEPPPAAISTPVAETVRVGVIPAASCVTVTVRVIRPVAPVKVRVAIRARELVLGVTVTVSVLMVGVLCV
jgi:hypothetical protein